MESHSLVLERREIDFVKCIKTERNRKKQTDGRREREGGAWRGGTRQTHMNTKYPGIEKEATRAQTSVYIIAAFGQTKIAQNLPQQSPLLVIFTAQISTVLPKSISQYGDKSAEPD